MTDKTATGRRLGRRSPRLETNGTSSKAPISTTGMPRMINVSAPGGLSESSANNHQNGQSGFGLAPSSAGSGKAPGPFGPAIAASDHDDDDGQRREQRILQHRFAEERHAVLVQILLVLLLICSRIDCLSRHRRRADPAFEHQPEMQCQQASSRPGMTNTCRAKNRLSVSPPMIGPPSSKSTRYGPTTGTRPAIDAPTPTPQYASASHRMTWPRECHAQRQEQQEHAREPVQFAGILVRPVQEDLRHMHHHHDDHRRSGPVVQRTQEPTERLLIIQVDQALISLVGRRHVHERQTDSGQDLDQEQSHGRAAEDVPPAHRPGGAAGNRMHQHRSHGRTQAQPGFEPCQNSLHRRSSAFVG